MHGIIAELLSQFTSELCDYLGDTLSRLSADWWQKYVLSQLSFQQIQIVEQHKISELSRLDLAALLRILDRNWLEISRVESFAPGTRNFVKELQTIRNRWAHAGSEKVPHDDLFRDFDTMQRLASAINADKYFIDKIVEEKQKLGNLQALKQPDVQSPAIEDLQSRAAEFQMGSIVCLRSAPSVEGAIVNVTLSVPENRYSVFISAGIREYYASQLQAKQDISPTLRLSSLPQFHAHLSAIQIQHPSLSTLYSLNAARIDFIPYQFRPVLKFIRSDRPRLLIADGVGVGKTIEAGLILRELQARNDIKSVLIICPKPLVTERKWETEMKRFDERFTHLDGKALRYCLNETDLEGEWPDQHAKTIIPYSLFDETLLQGTAISAGRHKKKTQGLLALNPPPRFDLVIVDETHHIKNPNTFAHKGVRFFCDNAEAVVFLTATPIMLGSRDLFTQLNILRPDMVIDEESFEHMAAPNPYINRAIDAARAACNGWQKEVRAALSEAAATSWGQSVLSFDPEFIRILTLLDSGSLLPGDRVSLIYDLEQTLTFSGMISRTRRRDIADFTVRKPVTVPVEFTPQQQQLHDDLLTVQSTILSLLHDNTNIKFLMTTIRRQAASCLFGLAPLLQNILTRRLDELEWDEVDDFFAPPDVATIDRIETQILEVIEHAENLDPIDPKLEALQKIIAEKQQADNKRIILFSSFRHTLRYLFEHLQADGVRVGMVHGGTPDDERVGFRKRFQLDHGESDALDVLLFSEIGCEGLDYQFCDCMVNYDLPWNPMRVEQRIGRIDRNGQKSESVLIYNLITPGTVDAEIYERCLMRIGVFNSALGAGEEILGEVAKEINDVAVDTALTDHQREEKLQQIADNEIRLIQEQQQLEDKQADFFGLRLPSEQTQHDIDSATSYWLSPQALENLATLYLQKIAGKNQKYLLGEKQLKTLRVSQDVRDLLLKDFHALKVKSSKTHKTWADWLKGKTPTLKLTFDAVCASDHPDIAFINPLHPLIRQSAKALEPRKKIVTALEVWDNSVPAGNYPFVIYQWQFYGVREDLVLYPVCESSELRQKVAELLPQGRTANSETQGMPNQLIFDALDMVHHALWDKARSEHQESTKRLAEHRRESLTASHNARVAMFREQLDQATDEKIRRMRQSQLDSANADYERRTQKLELAIGQADIIAQPVAYGIIQIHGVSNAE